jgi:4-amino-4-deoxy-L-arabinose transferase-like glycosyltransferase
VKLSTNSLCGIWAPIAIGAVAVLLRFIWIDQEFVDHWSWRQADVAMIARNFYENGFQLFWPQINWSGANPGYVGTEFPLVPAVAALLYLLLGEHEWIGRTISVAFFAISLPFLFLLVRRIYDERVALVTLIFYSIMPLTIFSGRSFMPDMASVSCIIAAVYFLYAWLEDQRPYFLLLATAFAALSLLIKITIIFVGLPMLYLCVTLRGWKSLLDYRLISAGIISVGIAAGWYMHAFQISLEYPPYHFFGSGGVSVITLEQVASITERTSKTFTPILLVLSLAGLFISGRAISQARYLFVFWFVACIIFVILTGHGNRHDWYRLPAAPAVAALAASATVHFWGILTSRIYRLGAAFGFLMALGWLSYAGVAPLYQSWALPALRAGKQIDRITPRDALIAAVDQGDPTLLYYSRRKGWHFLTNFGSTPANSKEAIKELEGLRASGADYLVFLEDTKWWLTSYPEFARHIRKYRIAASKSEYVLVDLRQRKPH